MSLHSKDFSKEESGTIGTHETKVIAIAETRSSLRNYKEFQVSSIEEAKDLGRVLTEKSCSSSEEPEPA